LMVLPILKLAFLAAKQVAKPIANQIKHYAINHPTLRESMISVGRRLNYNLVQLNRIAEGHTFLKRERVPVINEKDALVKGADFLAEVVVYSISASALLAEYFISKKNSRKAEAKAKDEAAKNEARQWEEFRQLNLRLAEVQDRLRAVEEAEEARRLQQQRWFGRYRFQ